MVPDIMSTGEKPTVASEVSELDPIDPGNMTFAEFNTEYEAVMQAVAEKEKKGGLDPNDLATYRPMSEDEYALLEEDWRAFSRSRGFSEEDIAEYKRWLKLSGQTDELPGAINDPWRRRQDYPGTWARKLYLAHVERSMLQENEIPAAVRESYEAERAVANEALRPKFASMAPNIVSITSIDHDTHDGGDDVW